MSSVLVVDDEAVVRRALHALLTKIGLTVTTAEDGVDARGKLAGSRFDVVITDLKMPRADGFEVLRAAHELQPGVPVLMLTGHGSINDCVAAMRAGAANFLSKPFHPTEFEHIVRRTLAAATEPPRTRRNATSALAKGEGAARPQVSLIGNAPRLLAVLDLLERVAATDVTVLITGETGTGKELAARLVHGTSTRAGRPFVAVNCGAIPENLIESELFGHAKGAFTGATERQAGRFALAEGGTLFLDEIGDLPMALQVRLLRVLQEHEIQPVGDPLPQPIDVRVIGATHRDLESMVAAGAFRQDLYYRLNVVQVEMPPLRDRAEDVPLLADRFLQAAAQRQRRRLALSPDACAALQAYRWPGNVRELENTMERLAIVTRSEEISLRDLPPKMRGSEEHARLPTSSNAASPTLDEQGINLPQTLAAIEWRLIEDALRRAHGNKNRAAALLGINRTTLVEKLKRKPT